MKSFLRLLIPVVIFLLTLEGLLQLWVHLHRDEISEGPTARQKWTNVKEGDPKRFPELDDMFQYPGTVSKLELFHQGELLGTTFYAINSFGLRDREGEAPKKTHAIVAGCSYVFGHGVNAPDMISSRLAELLPEVNVRNIGFPAGGLHTSLRYLEIVDPKLFVPEEEGVFLYVMIGDHLGRFLHDPSYLMWAPETAPSYALKDGKVSYAGRMREHASYRFMQFLRNFGLGEIVPGRFSFHRNEFSDEELGFFVAGVEELRRRYLAHFPKGRFLWVVHPLSGLHPDYGLRLERLARKRGLELLRADHHFQALLRSGKLKLREQRLKHDLHPSPKNNAFFAAWLNYHLFGGK